jgi:hypothetical protein
MGDIRLISYETAIPPIRAPYQLGIRRGERRGGCYVNHVGGSLPPLRRARVRPERARALSPTTSSAGPR